MDNEAVYDICKRQLDIPHPLIRYRPILARSQYLPYCAHLSEEAEIASKY
jgi:hypothetical protein